MNDKSNILSSTERRQILKNKGDKAHVTQNFYKALTEACKTIPMGVEMGFLRSYSIQQDMEFLKNIQELLTLFDVFTVFIQDLQNTETDIAELHKALAKTKETMDSTLDDQYYEQIAEHYKALDQKLEVYLSNKDINTLLKNKIHYDVIDGLWGYFSCGTRQLKYITDGVSLDIAQHKIKMVNHFASTWRFDLDLPLIQSDEPSRVADGMKFCKLSDLEEQFVRMVNSHAEHIKNRGGDDLFQSNEELVKSMEKFKALGVSLPVVARYSLLVDANRIKKAAMFLKADMNFSKYHKNVLKLSPLKKVKEWIDGVDPETCRGNIDSQEFREIEMPWTMVDIRNILKHLVTLTVAYRDYCEKNFLSTWKSLFPNCNIFDKEFSGML